MLRTIIGPLWASIQKNPWLGFVLLGAGLAYHTDHTAAAIAALARTDQSKADTVEVRDIRVQVAGLHKDMKEGFCFLSKGSMPGCAVYVRRLP